MELNFLNSDSPKLPENIKPFVPEVSDTQGKVVDLEYNKGKANLEHKAKNKEYAYVKRGIEYVANHGFKIAVNLKQALIDRANGLSSLSLREADIAYRGGLDLSNRLLKATIFEFTSFLTEDDDALSIGIFELRARYNKGLEWRKLKKKMCSLEKQEEGEGRIDEIAKILDYLQLPVHKEEKDDGFDKEMLKPEWLTWEQFNPLIQKATKFKSIETKRRYEELREIVKGIWK